MLIPLGQKLRELRDAKGLTLETLADHVEVSKSTISSYESGKTEPDFSEIQKLCRVLEVRAGYLFDEIPELLERPPKQVAAYESLRLYFEKHGPKKNAKHPYRRLLRVPDEAPKTVAEWELFHRRMGRVRGTGTGSPAQGRS